MSTFAVRKKVGYSKNGLGHSFDNTQLYMIKVTIGLIFYLTFIRFVSKNNMMRTRRNLIKILPQQSVFASALF